MLPTINQAVLSQVIQALKDGNVRYCEAWALTAKS